MRSNSGDQIHENSFRVLAAQIVIMLVLVYMIGCIKSKEEELKNRIKHGDVHAMYELGMANISASGDGIVANPNYRDAVYWLEEAANHGHTTSMYFLSQIGGQPEGQQAMWLKKGAELGNKACMIRIRDGYIHGAYGFPKDPIKAEEWQKRIRFIYDDELRKQGYVIQ